MKNRALTGLHEPHATALGQTIAFIRDRFQPAGIIVSGTIIRGAPDPASDLDVAVIHRALWRQRVQRRFNGVPAEIFINSLDRLTRTFTEEVASARPAMLHLVASGRIVLDPDGVMCELQQTARRILAGGPQSTAESLTIARYGIVTAYEDAEDIRDRDPERAAAMLIVATLDAARLHFRLHGRWIPREKALLRDLDEDDPDLAHLVRQVISSHHAEARFAAARQVVRTVTGATGFFRWESQPQAD